MMRSSTLALIIIGWILPGCLSQKESHHVGEFLPQDDRFWEVIPRTSFIERIGIAFEFTEGPAWHPEGFLIFSDIPANTMYRWTGKKYKVFRQPSNHSNGLLLDSDGALFVCEHGSRSLARYSPGGRLDTLADQYLGRRLNSPNDLCMASDGSLYFTDPPWGLSARNDDPSKELPFNGVFRWHQGSLSLIDSTLSWPNGIALSPDEKYLYVANFEITLVEGEEQYQVFWMRYTLNEQGRVMDRTLFFTATDTSLPGGPDGMKVDKNGNLFLTGPGGILVVDPEGTHLGTIAIPIPATNLSFGPNEKELFITARSTLYRMVLK